MTTQRRMRSIAMTADEIDAFLSEQRTCRVATVSANGSPHVTPMWFVWDGEAIWLNSVVRSQRWIDIGRSPQIAVVVDAGTEYTELRGVEIRGDAESVGDVPRTSQPIPELREPEWLMGSKYSANGIFAADGKHAWLRVTPRQVLSWDFRKNPALTRD